MAEYDLYGLETRTFQHLCQALAVKVLGSGVTVYGDGRDGARDASFRGKLAYPTTAEQWDGSLIIQAKFRKVRIDDPAKAGAWVISSLKDDLTKFIGAPQSRNAPPPKRHPPDYYLLVTNVELTPFPDTGTEALVSRLLAEYSSYLHFKGYDVWDGRKLLALLDGHRDIAITYGGYITAGDVLAEMQQWLTGLKPDFTTVMADFLQGELSGSDQYARLSEAGSTAQRRPLAHVFVDLPVSEKPLADASAEKLSDDGNLPGGFVSEVLAISSRRLDRASVLERKKERDEPDVDVYDSGRIVLIGGPGQGKSTLGQYVCQLFRAAILMDRDPNRVSDEAAEALILISDRCAEDNISLPKARRFPVRVELKAFADDLANGKCASLLEYIAQRIDRRSGKVVDRDNLELWLAAYPWLIVLDGLDEVPATANRETLLDAIQQFNSQCATRNADVFIIATSRPQGYGDAFSTKFYDHRYLTPLSTVRALDYAKRLVAACHDEDPEIQGEILRRLTKASTHASTQRLMLSPLQVTILAVLAELHGELPDDRWDLFAEYYQTIYKRETQRNQDLAAILRTYHTEIDQLHEQVGLRLQALNGNPGENDRFLTRDEFASMVRKRLTDRLDENDEQLHVTAKAIEDAAFHRLVFLVSPKGDDVGFELRSLQEFMAARAITDGSDGEICLRLQAIAPSPYWRNVFLFAAGRCYRDRRHLIENILGICTTLNTDPENPLAVATVAGSRLALDLLEDATFYRNRRYSAALAEHALKLLSVPMWTELTRLAALCQSGTHVLAFYREAISKRIEGHKAEEQLGAWLVLIRLLDQGHSWAFELADRSWPACPEDQMAILRLAGVWEMSSIPWLVSKRLALACVMHPQMLESTIPVELQPSWLSAFKRLNERDDVASMLPLEFSAGVDRTAWLPLPVLPTQTDEDWMNVSSIPEPCAIWKTLCHVGSFVRNPCKESLAGALHKIAESNDWRRWLNAADFIPWPIGFCLSRRNAAGNLSAAATAVERGEFGDITDWQECESRWRSSGITVRDLETALYGKEFSCASAWKYLAADLSCKGPAESGANADLFMDLYDDHISAPNRYILADLIIGSFSNMVRPEGGKLARLPSAEICQSWFAETSVPGSYAVYLPIVVPWPSKLSPEWLNALDGIGRTIGSAIRPRPILREREIASDFNRCVTNGFIEQPSRTGLLTWIAGFVWFDKRLEIPPELLWPDKDDDPFVVANKIAILMVVGQLSSGEARELAKVATRTIVDGSPRTMMMPDLYLRQGARANDWPIDFVLELLARLPIEDSFDRQNCLQWLMRRIAELPSPFNQHATVERLGLSGIL